MSPNEMEITIEGVFERCGHVEAWMDLDAETRTRIARCIADAVAWAVPVGPPIEPHRPDTRLNDDAQRHEKEADKWRELYRKLAAKTSRCYPGQIDLHEDGSWNYSR